MPPPDLLRSKKTHFKIVSTPKREGASGVGTVSGWHARFQIASHRADVALRGGFSTRYR
jgi:hypothetical protein